MELKRLVIELRADTKKKLAMQAVKQGVSQSQIVRGLIVKYLNKPEPLKRLTKRG